MRTEIALWNLVDDAVEAASGIDLGLLTALHQMQAGRGRCRVEDISQGIGITVGAASKVVHRLETAELVVRTANVDDRRSSLIVLTDAGRRTLRQGIVPMQRALESATAGPAALDISALTAQLQQLQNDSERVDLPRAS